MQALPVAKIEFHQALVEGHLLVAGNGTGQQGATAKGTGIDGVEFLLMQGPGQLAVLLFEIMGHRHMTLYVTESLRGLGLDVTYERELHGCATVVICKWEY